MIFALLGIGLAVVGVYGVASYTLAQRRREIAIRVALGARRGQIMSLILGEGVIVGLVGIGIGPIVVFLATLLPSRRAARIDAVESLKSD